MPHMMSVTATSLKLHIEKAPKFCLFFFPFVFVMLPCIKIVVHFLQFQVHRGRLSDHRSKEFGYMIGRETAAMIMQSATENGLYYSHS